MTTTEEKIKINLAIYRGLPDVERLNKLEEIRFKAAQHPTPEVRALARKFLPAVEHAEAEIQRERRAVMEQARREATQAVQTRTVYVQTGYSSPDDERRTWEIRRGLLAFVGIAIVGAGIVSSVLWVVNSGIVPWLLGGALVVFCVSGIRSGSGTTRTDTPNTAGGTGQNININISGQGGNIYVNEQKAQA